MLLALACLLVMAGAETVMLHLWGTTPGKALLGLKILREDGTPLSLPESARRAGMVAAFSGIFYLLAGLPWEAPFLGAGQPDIPGRQRPL